MHVNMESVRSMKKGSGGTSQNSSALRGVFLQETMSSKIQWCPGNWDLQICFELRALGMWEGSPEQTFRGDRADACIKCFFLYLQQKSGSELRKR